MSDRDILRGLAREYANISQLDVQNQNINNWKRLYGLNPVKPVVMIDQIPWHEMNVNDELTIRCKDLFAQKLEWQLRSTIYRWKHFPCDMVVTPYFAISKQISNSGIGVSASNQDESGHDNAQTHLYEDSIADYDALEKLHNPVITYEKEKSERTKERTEEYFGDILPVKLVGDIMWEAIWDRIVFWRGATPVLYDLADRPEFLHDLMKKLISIEHSIIDQYEKENLFRTHGAICHCTETYCDELPKSEFEPEHIRAKDCWVSGAAQIFSEVSPNMHDEFEIEYMLPIYKRFGLVNYGCCEQLHNKIDIVKKIPNVRAISTSPWADVNRTAEQLGKDFVMARKPNPSYVAGGYLDEDSVKAQVKETIEACKQNNTPVMFILKDITTVNNHPERLDNWYKIVKSQIDKSL